MPTTLDRQKPKARLTSQVLAVALAWRYWASCTSSYTFHAAVRRTALALRPVAPTAASSEGAGWRPKNSVTTASAVAPPRGNRTAPVGRRCGRRRAPALAGATAGGEVGVPALVGRNERVGRIRFSLGVGRRAAWLKAVPCGGRVSPRREHLLLYQPAQECLRQPACVTPRAASAPTTVSTWRALSPGLQS